MTGAVTRARCNVAPQRPIGNCILWDVDVAGSIPVAQTIDCIRVLAVACSRFQFQRRKIQRNGGAWMRNLSHPVRGFTLAMTLVAVLLMFFAPGEGHVRID